MSADLSGDWNIFQGNGFVVHVGLSQTAEGKLFGSASHSNGQVKSKEGDGVTGFVFQRPTPDGHLVGDRMELTITWDDGSKGVYSGNFLTDGLLQGVTHDANNLASQATWVSDQRFPG